MNESTLILTEHRLAPRLFDAALTLIAGRIPVFPVRRAVDAVNRGGRSPLERNYRLF